MALNIKLLSLGAIIAFTPDGTAITIGEDDGNSSKAFKPSADGDWKEFTTVESGEIAAKFNDEEVFSPSPGAYRRTDILRSMLAMDIKFTGQQINELILQSVFQTPVLANTVSAAVGNKLGQVRGWLQVSEASQNDAVVILLQVYGILTCDLVKADGKLFKPEVKFAVLYNSLATVTPSLLAA
jgi:hypothetical protein